MSTEHGPADIQAAGAPDTKSNMREPESPSADPARNNTAEYEETPSLPPRPDMGSIPAAPPEDADESDAPQIAALRGMFPDFDGALLQSVLESVNYDQDRAIDVLLGMSDPEYISTQAPASDQHDLALDEQLARQLALEDQQQLPPRATGESWPRRGSEVPYQTRQPAPSQQQQQQQQQQYVTGSERGDFSELQETLGRMAESGKRTFSSIVSKAKAKINEYNQQYSQQRSGQGQGQGYASTSPPANPQWGTAPPPQLDRHTAQEAYANQYYGEEFPNTGSDGDRTPSPITLSDHTQLKGYDVGASEPVGVPAPASPPATSAGRPSSPPAAAQSRASVSSRPSGEVPRPPPISASGTIDAAKLGLLPRKPVSLLPVNTQPAPAAQRSNSEDELEYAENPFEEGRD
ncbi:hypothetical protein WOLCODRAFT_140198 [Wolfiporia cocos MD-104 SS10]|uniref:CUE domain-containing protein n=1 Tax=Wolfiporia cocos (strain MD-104) TaxID=742152 RepID=A0A2H3J240_WOLCO|nr:hypothetical protein WOLCODRAFT_140198 [Wolfiporia cocos MD-104 SS10]